MLDTNEITQRYMKHITRYNMLHKELENKELEVTKLLRERITIEQVHELIKQAALKTQEQLEYHVSEIVTLALAAVFDEPYELKIKFVERRGKTECDIVFVRDGKEVYPQDASGGGAIDVASLALRFSLWALQIKKTSPVIILDEPFKFLSKDLQPKAGKMLQEISKKLDLQLIMVTHNDDLIDSATKVFRVNMKEGVSHAV